MQVCNSKLHVADNENRSSSYSSPHLDTNSLLLPVMTASMLRKVDWAALKSAASDLSIHDFDEISEITSVMREDDSVLRRIHHLLFEVHLLDGHLVCPES